MAAISSGLNEMVRACQEYDEGTEVLNSPSSLQSSEYLSAVQKIFSI